MINREQRFLELTRAGVKLDADDHDLFMDHASHIGGNGYVYLTKKNARTKKWQTKLVHRLIVARMIGRALTSDELVDHINGNRKDIRRKNLRVVTAAENTHNRKVRKDSGTGLRGVMYNKEIRKFTATLRCDGIVINLGSFTDPLKAYLRGIEARKELMPGYVPPKSINFGKIELLRAMRDADEREFNDGYSTRLRSTNTTGYRWVSWAKHAKKYVATAWCTDAKKKVVLGYFSDPLDAHNAAKAYYEA